MICIPFVSDENPEYVVLLHITESQFRIFLQNVTNMCIVEGHEATLDWFETAVIVSELTINQNRNRS
jgi:hypothetical protein